MTKLTLLLAGVVFVGTLRSLAQDIRNPAHDSAESIEQQISKVKKSSKTYAAVFSEARAHASASSVEDASALIEDARASRTAYRDMLTSALAERPVDPIAFTLIRGLSEFELPPEGLEAVLFYLGASEKSKVTANPKDAKTRDVIAWLNRQSVYPAYDALLQQGTRVVPFMQDRLPGLEKNGASFQNGIRLLVQLMGKEAMAKWLAEKNGLTPGQNEAARNILAQVEKDQAGSSGQ